MDTNLKNLIVSELHSSSAYIDRCFHALINIGKLQNHPKIKELAQTLHFDLIDLLEINLLKKSFINEDMVSLSTKEVRAKLKSAHRLIESLIQLDFNETGVVKLTVNYINLIYRYANELHQFASDHLDVEIQLPRITLIEAKGLKTADNEDEKPDISNNGKLPLFSLSLSTVKEMAESGSISSLEWQRDKKYEALIHEGHECIFKKEPEKALEKFKKALNFKDSAEALTLVGWAHSLLGKDELAKKYCLKAIKKDPDFGPPYNDMGSYLLNEGEVDESLKWFELAKKSTNYQNREYPYINAGRAYMAKRQLGKALEEFSKALTLAPYHEELHKTVEKIKDSLYKSTQDETQGNSEKPSET